MLKKILKKFEDMNSNTVTQDMLVGDIVRLHPEVVDTLLSQRHALPRLPFVSTGKFSQCLHGTRT